MNSSRRPSYSTAARPRKSPTWRSMSISKKSASASVSLVFAEPETGAPLASATSQLPTSAILVTEESAGSDKSIRKFSTTSSIPGEQKERGLEENCEAEGSNGPTAKPSVESLRETFDPAQEPAKFSGESPALDARPAILTPPTVTESLSDSPGHTTPSGDAVIPFPSLDSDKSSSKPAPSPSSWFGSFGRVKGKNNLAKIKETQSIAADRAEFSLVESQLSDPSASKPEKVSLPIVQVQPPTPPQPPSSSFQDIPSKGTNSEPQLIPTAAHSKSTARSWFSSSPSPTSPPQSGLSPTQSPLTSSHSSLSIDEEVPTLSSVTPPPPASPSIVSNSPNNGTGTHSARLSSLNPSTSRFTLSIPLLGRPKMPLDQAVAVARAGESQASTSVEQTSMTMTTSTSDNTTDEPSIAPSGDPGLSASDSTPSAVENRTGHEARVASWWDYVPWSGTGSAIVSTTPSAGDPLRSGCEMATPNTEPTKSPTMSHANTRSEASAPQPNIKADTNASRGSDDTTDDGDRTIKLVPKAASLKSTDTTQSQGSIWYSPLAWYYGSSTTLPTENTPELGIASKDGVKTESEMVKEEALARADTTDEPHRQEQERGRSSIPYETPNPIESSIASNRGSWASFFASSKTLVVKRVTGTDLQRDENGMEVMDIPDDPDAPDVTEAGTGTNTSPDQGKSGARRLSGKSKGTPPPSPKAAERPTGPAAPPLTISDSVRRETADVNAKRRSSSAPSKKPVNGPPPRTPLPNLVLPTWQDTFHAPPRNLVPPAPTSKLAKTMKFVSGVLFARDDDHDGAVKGKGKAREREFAHFGKELPRAWDILTPNSIESKVKLNEDVLRGCKRVAVIGIHGWFPGAVMRTVLGEPTGTSTKFVNMMVQALDEFQAKHGVKLEKVATIPLEGEGTINGRVEKLYTNLLANQEWMEDLHTADAIIIATHSQGSIVSTHLLDRLIRDRHIRTARIADSADAASSSSSGTTATPTLEPQRICCLALCGIHLGPLRYLSSSSLIQPYFQYFESTAARELFEFQNTESQVSRDYVKALRNVVNNGTKIVYVASLNDQVVPIYSGLFTSVSHPLILRALYIDGDAYHSSDFLSNLLVLLLRILNSGLSDSGLLAHLSEATAGSLNGVGHSTVYEELGTYSLAVNYLFLTNSGLDNHPELTLEPFNATAEQNDYEIPWALRDLIADDRVFHFFSDEITQLRDAFREWHPKTTILRDVKRKLQPIQRLPSVKKDTTDSISKL